MLWRVNAVRTLGLAVFLALLAGGVHGDGRPFLVSDLSTAGGNVCPLELTVAGKKLLFTFDDGVRKMSLWSLDTVTTAVVPLNCRAWGLFPAGAEKVVFYGEGDCLWRSDGTPGGTDVLTSPTLGRTTFIGSDAIARGDGCVYYLSYLHDYDEFLLLCRTDGSDEGTYALGEVGCDYYPFFIGVTDNRVYVLGNTGGRDGRALWWCEKHPSETHLVGQWDSVAPGEGFAPVGMGDAVFFYNDQSLWRSDGTPEGTDILKDLEALHSFNPYVRPVVAGGKVFFLSWTSPDATVLWTSDGTEAGTEPVLNLGARGDGRSPSSLVSMNGQVYFFCSDRDHGTELWRSDGTAAGTGLVKDIRPGPESGCTWNICVFDDKLVFTANDGVSGLELWRSDGTEAGTECIGDICAGPCGSCPSKIVLADNRVYFSAWDGTRRGIWAVSHPPAAPVNPGSQSIAPDAIVWKWGDASDYETGFLVWAGEGAEPADALSAVTGRNATSWRQGGLAANTLYSFQVAARGYECESGRTPVHSAWTLASPPAAPLARGESSGSLVLSVPGGDGNPPGTEYAVRHMNSGMWVAPDGALSAEGAWAVLDAWASVTVAGLPPATEQRFEVVARNGADVVTAGAPCAAFTLAVVPAVVGRMVGEALAAITAAGLSADPVVEVYDAVHPAGLVLGQLPEGGAEMAPGGAVALTVSKGAAPVAVPDVVGKSRGEASGLVVALGLRVGGVAEVYDESIPAGIVVRQSPGAGTLLPPDSAVALVVSLGAAPVTVPNVVRMPRRTALAALADAGLSVGVVSEELHPSVAPGCVITQTPRAGEVVDRGAAVALTVSLGPGPLPVSVPRLLGMTPEGARDVLESAGLAAGPVTEAHSAAVAAGRVAGQDPPAGAPAAPGTAVALVLSSGVDPESLATARELLCGDFTELDTDGNGRLSIEEARARIGTLTDMFFAALDVNGDGGLDESELAPVARCGCRPAAQACRPLKARFGDLFLGALSLMAMTALGHQRKR